MNFQNTVGAIFGAWLFMIATPVLAQKMISLDGDKCAAGLDAVANLIDGTVRADSPPRKLAGKCEARNVRVTSNNGGFSITIKKVQWGSGDLAVLADGNLPESLHLVLSGTTVLSAPKNDPVWGFIQQNSQGFRGIDAELNLSFSEAENQLDINGLILDFHNGNKVLASARARTVSPKILSRPEILALPVSIETLDLTISGNRQFGNDIVRAAIETIPTENRPKGGMAGFAAGLKQGAKDHLSAVLDIAAMAALTNLIDDIPHPAGTASLRIHSEKGIPLLRLLALSVGADAAKMLDGAQVTFEHDTNPLAVSN